MGKDGEGIITFENNVFCKFNPELVSVVKTGAEVVEKPGTGFINSDEA